MPNTDGRFPGSARSISTPTSAVTSEKTIAGFSIKELRQPPERRLPWHVHDGASLCFVLSGSYTERLRGVDRECSPHTVVFKPPFELHADRFHRCGGTCLLIELSASRLEAIEPVSTIATEPGLIRNARLAAFGRHIYREVRGVDALSALAVEGLILEVLVETTRAVARERSAGAPTWLRRAHELLHDTFRDPLSLSSVASTINIHPAHLARVFRKHYGTSLGDYMRRLRVEYASIELARPDPSLAEISMGAGFFDQSHFSRVFKQYTGQTPTEYRAASLGLAQHRRARVVDAARPPGDAGSVSACSPAAGSQFVGGGAGGCGECDAANA
jgi:AraC-like DNA-binding protein